MSPCRTLTQQNQISHWDPRSKGGHSVRNTWSFFVLKTVNVWKTSEKHCDIRQFCTQGQASKGKCDLPAGLHPLSKCNSACLQHSLFTDALSTLETLYLHTSIAKPFFAQTNTEYNHMHKILLLLVKLICSSCVASLRVNFLCKKVPVEITQRKWSPGKSNIHLASLT